MLKNLCYKGNVDRRPSSCWPPVIAFAVLIGIALWTLIPVFKSAERAAREARTDMPARAVALAVDQYADDHHGSLPTFRNSDEGLKAVTNYIKDPKVLQEAQRFVWNTNMSRKKLTDLDDNDWILYSAHPHGWPTNAIAYVNGTARPISDDELARLLAKSNQSRVTDRSSSSKL